MSTAKSPLPTAQDRRASRWTLSRTMFVAAALIPSLVAAWVLWLAPVGDLAGDRTAIAARDFTALWGAGRLAGEHATAALADPALFTQHLRAWFGAGIPNQIWPYPPPILLLAAPLALLPIGWSFAVYTGATLAGLWTVLRVAQLPRPICLLALLSPAIADNALIGQNGAMTTAFLVGGLLLVDARPIVAGILLGALILKPQLGLLIPFCLVAGARWRVGTAMFATSATIAAASWACFGTSAWNDYVVTARPAITAYFQAPWDPASSQRIFASAFMAARSLGATLTTAYAVQAIVTLSCAVLACRAWRRPGGEPRRRMAITVALTCLASPWVHSYDMPALAIAILLLADASRPQHLPYLALAWCWPGAQSLLALPNTLLVLSTASIAWLASHDALNPRSWQTLRCA